MDPGSHAPAGKAAIVTAAGKGMGAACARELATRGYSLALMSCSEEATDLARDLGGVGLVGSVTQEADLRALVDKTLDAYGRVPRLLFPTLGARWLHQALRGPLRSAGHPDEQRTTRLCRELRGG